MARKKKGNKVDGWLIIDKPLDIGSTNVVAIVKRAFNAQKVGHAGTLDPLATGVLPIALGEATKTVPFTMDATKTYEVTVRFGEERNTDDLEGEVTATCALRPDRTAILTVLPQFLGEIQQTPPAFSAIKIDGKRAYAEARAGKDVALKARPVTIHRIEIIKQVDERDWVFQVTCGKGTYIRAFARDLGRAIGGHATVATLRRTRVGPFDAGEAIPLDRIRDLIDSPATSQGGQESPDGFSLLRPIDLALDDLPRLQVTADDAKSLRHGRAVRLNRWMADQLAGQSPQIPIRLYEGGRVFALGEKRQGAIHPTRILNV